MTSRATARPTSLPSLDLTTTRIPGHSLSGLRTRQTVRPTSRSCRTVRRVMTSQLQLLRPPARRSPHGSTSQAPVGLLVHPTFLLLDNAASSRGRRAEPTPRSATT
jgi:hypothetical protein